MHNLFSKLRNFLSFLCVFLVIILAREKTSTEGCSTSDRQKNDGPGRIRTGDLRRVNAPLEVAAASIAASNPQNQLDHSPFVPQVLSELVLPFTLDELTGYAERRKYGLSRYSTDWIDRAQIAIWNCTHGVVSKKTLDELRIYVLKRYRSEVSHTKVLSFTKAFLKFLTKARLDTRYHAFEVFFERPRRIKARNNVRSRIVMKKDIENVLAHINAVHEQSVELKAKIAVARNVMDEKDAHLKAYEEYLAGIEGELSELIRNVKGRVYRLDGETGQQLREILAESGNELYALIEALPSYEALAIDEAMYEKEYAELVNS